MNPGRPALSPAHRPFVRPPMSAGSERPALPECGSLSTEVRNRARLRGVTLIECLVYISVLFVILAVAGVVYAQVLDHTRQLRRVSGDITRALDAGERWRADVRGAIAAPRLVQEGPLEALHVPQREAEVVYFFDGSNVVRRVGDDGAWQPFLPRVKAARFVVDPRQHVTAWRWEVELLSGPRPTRVPPLFSFTAALRPAAP